MAHIEAAVDVGLGVEVKMEAGVGFDRPELGFDLPFWHKNRYWTWGESDPYNVHSAVLGQFKMAVTPQPLATETAIDVLKGGGNAADAAVAAMLVVFLLEPMFSSLGGDCTIMLYDDLLCEVKSINGSGMSGKAAIIDVLQAIASLLIPPRNNGAYVTVPGGPAAMATLILKYGEAKIDPPELVARAIELASIGAPIPRKAAHEWQRQFEVIEPFPTHIELDVTDLDPLSGPKYGECIRNPTYAQTLGEIVITFATDFYIGDIAAKIIATVVLAGGLLTPDDFIIYGGEELFFQPEDPLFIDFHCRRIWEMKPSTVGIVVLVALNILKPYDLYALGHNSPMYIHYVATAIKMAYTGTWECLCDPDYCLLPILDLLTDEYADHLRESFSEEKLRMAIPAYSSGSGSHVAVVDELGNAVSIVCTLGSGFGSGLIPPDTGFVLNDRGRFLNLRESGCNSYGPGKVPVQPEIPGMVTDPITNELLGVIGGTSRWMNPQQHIQVLLNMIIFGMDPQIALYQPRFFVGLPDAYAEYRATGGMLFLEAGISKRTGDMLKARGHIVKYAYGDDREIFGRGHIIAKRALWDVERYDNCSLIDLGDLTDCGWWGATDPRSDGVAMGY